MQEYDYLNNNQPTPDDYNYCPDNLIDILIKVFEWEQKEKNNESKTIIRKTK